MNTASTPLGFAGTPAVVGNGHYWLYLLHTMIVAFVVSTVTWTITIVWTLSGLGGRLHHRGSVLLLRGRRSDARDSSVPDPRAHHAAPGDRAGHARILHIRCAPTPGGRPQRVSRCRNLGGGTLPAQAGARHPRWPAAAPGSPADGPRRGRSPTRCGSGEGAWPHRRSHATVTGRPRRAACAVPRLRPAHPDGSRADRSPRVCCGAMPSARPDHQRAPRWHWAFRRHWAIRWHWAFRRHRTAPGD